MDVWAYVFTHDRGVAPNFEPPETTLTLCKPRIRKRAKRGDLVLAFNGATLSCERHSVRWAGVVSEVIPFKDYWRDPRFDGKRPGRPRGPEQKPDNIYRPTDEGGFERVENDAHAPASIRRDLGGVNALILKPSWYFGGTNPILPADFNLRIVGGRIGERRKPIDEPTWRRLVQWLDKNRPNAVQPSTDRNNAREPGSGRC
jgi:Nucleotide modification associated domain 2